MDVKSEKSNVSATSDEEDNDEEFVPKASRKSNQDKKKVAAKRNSRRSSTAKGRCPAFVHVECCSGHASILKAYTCETTVGFVKHKLPIIGMSC